MGVLLACSPAIRRSDRQSCRIVWTGASESALTSPSSRTQLPSVGSACVDLAARPDLEGAASTTTRPLCTRSIRRWWQQQMGRPVYQDATTLLITADAGGSNGARLRLWKWELQLLAVGVGTAVAGRLDLIRFRGHLLKGDYDVHNGRNAGEGSTGPSTLHR